MSNRWREVRMKETRDWTLLLGVTVLWLCASSANISDFCAAVQLIRLTTERTRLVRGRLRREVGI